MSSATMLRPIQT